MRGSRKEVDRLPSAPCEPGAVPLIKLKLRSMHQISTAWEDNRVRSSQRQPKLACVPEQSLSLALRDFAGQQVKLVSYSNPCVHDTPHSEVDRVFVSSPPKAESLKGVSTLAWCRRLRRALGAHPGQRCPSSNFARALGEKIDGRMPIPLEGKANVLGPSLIWSPNFRQWSL